MKISTLTLSSVRGIPSGWPELQIGEKGLVVLGPNGAGKSSIIDGLEFAITGESSLFPDTRAGVSWKTASRHIRGGSTRVDVGLRKNGVDHLLSTASKPSGEVSDWQKAACRSRFVLRRHMLLKFIESTPKDRYTRLEPFLNLDEFLGVEAALETLSSLTKTAALSEIARASETEQRLRAVFSLGSETDITRSRLIATLNEQLTKCGMTPFLDTDNPREFQALIDVELEGYAQDARLSALHGLRAQLQKLTLPATYRPLVEQLRVALSDLESAEKIRSGKIPTEFLTRAKALLSSERIDNCPLCEQAIEQDLLVSRLQDRIEADERLTTALGVVKASKRAAIEPLEHLAHAMEQFIVDWEGCMPVPLSEDYRQTATLLKDTVAALNAKVDSRLAQQLSARFAAALVSHEGASATLQSQIARETGGERRKLLAETCPMIRCLELQWPVHEKARERVTIANKKVKSADRLYGLAVEARKKAVQLVLDDVADIANVFYDSLHPGENIAKSKLTVRASQEGSIMLETDFYGKAGPPLLHYSESHLDTLGLCYFLALRKREAVGSPDFKVVVFDDVMHSVDAKHRSKFASLLKREFDDHQIIIVTHDDVFYQRLRQTLGNRCHFVSITDWDIERGPFLGDASTDLDTILDVAAHRTQSTRDLAAACGRFFEWLLRGATESLQIAIPARFSRGHDIGSMWTPLASKMRKQRHLNAAYPKLCDDIDAHLWVRNLSGAHYNEPAAPPEPEEARRLARSLAVLYRAVHCDDCNEFLQRSGDHNWHCQCGSLSFCPASTKHE